MNMSKIIFNRSLKAKINPLLYQGKVIILYGPRQVGKTTLANQIISEHPDSLYLNCERTSVRDLLLQRNLTQIKDYIGNARLVVFDEAQKIVDVGEILKLLIDTYPQIQYIATGSSSFDLSNALSEPLTGRNVKFVMYPLSIIEMSAVYDRFQQDEMLEQLLLYGSYPDIVSRPVDQKLKLLDELANDYLFRDALQFENIRKSDVLFNLLKAIALQIGSEVSLRELSGLLKVAVDTVQRYLALLEKSFVIYSLPSFSRNLRNEIAKGQKYYFYDLGIRNNLLQNFTPIANRNDIGQLWENFCLIERIKYNQSFDRRVNHYFWRTYQQKEIDLIEEHSGQLHAFDFKWSDKVKAKMPDNFNSAYPDSTFQEVNPENYHQFLVHNEEA
jgi:uncharacterized protein